MSRRIACPRALAVPLTALASLPALAQEPAQTPVFGVELDVVRLDVVVLDRDEAPVHGLLVDDFDIEEEGEPRKIVSFEAVVVPPRPAAPPERPEISANRLRSPSEGRSILVLFDDIHVTPVLSQFVRDALARFIRQDLRDGDWLTIVSPGQQLRWTARNEWELELMVPFVERLQGRLVRDPGGLGITDWEAVRINEYGMSGLTSPGLSDMAGSPGGGYVPEGVPESSGDSSEPRMGVGVTDRGFLSEEVTAVAKRRIDASLSAVRHAVESLAGIGGHKSLILISEGFVLLPRMPRYEELLDLARKARVAIHLLDPRAFESGYTGEEAGAAADHNVGTLRMLDSIGSEDVAAATGGRVLTGNDPLRGLRQVAREAEAYYLIGFQPGDSGEDVREVRVRVRGDGRTVRARTRYVATKREAPPERDDQERRTDSLRSVAETSDLPLRVKTFFFESTRRGEVTTMYATEIRYARGTEGRRKIRTVAEAYPRDAGEPLRDEFDETLEVGAGRPTILSRHWHMPPGVWQIRVLVEDVETGRVGTALHTFQVPEANSFRLSTPILTSELEERDGQPRPRIVLSRTYREGQVLYCQIQVHGAADDPREKLPRVLAGYELRKGDIVVRAAEATRIRPEWDGRLSRLVGLSLEGAATGSYRLVLDVHDEITGRTLRTEEPFTVLSR